MNETALHSLSERFKVTDLKADTCNSLIGLIRKALLSDLLSESFKPFYLSSQLYDVHYFDPYVAGDHPEIMTTFLEKSLLSTVKGEAAGIGVFGGETSVRLDGFALDDSGEESQMDLHLQKNNHPLDSMIIKEEDALKAIKPCQNLERKTYEVLRQLEQDPQMVDFKISLFITACNNVRLKPFPDHIVDESPEGMQGLLLINDLIPPVEVLLQSIRRNNKFQLNDQVINLIHWLTVQLRQPKLHAIPQENYDSVFQRVEFAINVEDPTHVFKIMVNNLSSNHLQWQAARGKHSTKFAFYGARVEHIHSLVHLGLYPFQKVAGPLGHGIYLTSDLKSCLESSPPSWVWGKSTMGTQLQTVAVVEFISSNPKVVCYRDKNKPCSREAACHGKPYHYYVPYNNLIQARYLLIFVKDSHKIQTNALHFYTKQKETREAWRKIFLIGGYLALCFVSWKSLRNSDNPSIWYIIMEKLRSNHILRPFTLFMQPPTVLY
ncbi:hypothetical protein GE061_019822 [Apolygus lucorum]|uniref:PARP16 N-terminal domain-containing protein n=1 Tax=Apolygus lucorum TaxID=248454 RepID=A0A6A4IZC3_APOLU|nr:hypothetical protein GE061_019822 [Apolygus lucorum]